MDWIKRWFVTTTMGKELESVRELRVFAEAMPSLQEIMATPGAGEVVEYECDGGFCVGFYAYRREGPTAFAVQWAVISGGATLRRHVHDETETLTLCYGRLSVLLDEDAVPVTIEAPDVILFDIGQAHTVTALETSWFVGVIIPSSPGYPTRGPGN